MIFPAELRRGTCYYPFGNTRAVSLTQDLPANQDADILLLGCGDARNILFTCFADSTRKIDVTSCDNEPLIHARNILLYSLLIEDEGNINIDRIWNIYYHWKLDKESLELLEIQILKLLRVSNSIDEWHDSVYGSRIRFCDFESLSYVRAHWKGFQLQGLSRSEKKCHLKQMQARINEAKNSRSRVFGRMKSKSFDGLDAAAPADFDAAQVVCEISDHWWEHGTMVSSTLKPTILNPAFLYSPNPAPSLHFDLNPLLGLPLTTAFTPITEGSDFFVERKNASSTHHLVNCVKNIFAQWASAFRKNIANKLIIRIFCGDALNFCLTLRNCQATNQFQYGGAKNATPLKFDVIDTSNLIDHLGLLNVIAAASSILKYHVSSSLYVQMLRLLDPDPIKRLFGMFGVDACSMSLLLGLVSPDLFTNATNSFVKEPVSEAVLEWSGYERAQGFSPSRFRWKRPPGYQESSICVEEKALANMMVQVYHAMFKQEDLASMFNMIRDPPKLLGELHKLYLVHYNRASFAFLLSCLQATVVCDWNQCVEHVYNGIFSTAPSGSIMLKYTEDLLINMHFFGMDNGRFRKPAPVDIRGALLAPHLPINEKLPVQLCVTVRVLREKLKFFFEKDISLKLMPVLLTCSFMGGDPGEKPWSNNFSTIRIAFGTWHEGSKENQSYPYIKEVSSYLLNTSDMFVSVMVPTWMLLQSKQFVPWVNIGLIITPETYKLFKKDLGKDLSFARCQMTSKDVFITQYPPGMSSLPSFSLTSTRSDRPILAATTARLTHDGLKIETLTRRITLESQEAKDKLANPSSTVEIKFASPWTAAVHIAQSQELKFRFPAPVSLSKYKVRIARKSSYIEVETRLLNPLTEDIPSFIFPTFISEAPCGTTIPISWVSTHIDLDIMPPIDLKDPHAILWLVGHGSVMFSERERRIHKSSMSNRSVSGAQKDIRTSVKDGLFSMLMHYTGLRGEQASCFGLTTTNGDIETLIFPSCLRLDLVNRTVVLDAAIIPTTSAMLSDPRADKFLKELSSHGLCQVKVSTDENLAWKAMMPALVERCRTAATWEHTSGCEYVKSGQAPLYTEVSADGVSPFCSCGIGKFPPGDYLKSQMERFSDFRYMINCYAARAAIGPIFSVQEVEDCSIQDFAKKLGSCMVLNVFKGTSAKIKRYFRNLGMYNKEKCVIREKCAKCKRENDESAKEKLLHCSRCGIAKYCSRKCQMADWQKHKPLCFTTLEKADGREDSMPFHKALGDGFFTIHKENIAKVQSLLNQPGASLELRCTAIDLN